MNEKCKLCVHYITKNDMGFICHYCNIKEGDKEIFELRGCDKYIRRDLVQVIRCKDCKYWNPKFNYCEGIGNWFGIVGEWGENGFCYKGERRTDGTN